MELQPAANTNDIHESVVCRLVHEKISDSSEFIALSTLYGDITVTEPIYLNGTRVVIPLQVAQALRYIRAVFAAPWSSTSSEGSAKSSLNSHCQSLPQQPPPPPPSSPSCSSLAATAAAPPPSSSSHQPKSAPRWLRSLLKNVNFVRHLLADPLKPAPSQQPLRIWIDLLCINEQQEQEQEERRSHTAFAFRHAKMVVGWLGVKDSTSDLAIEIIRAWDECMPRSFGEPGDREIHPDDYAPKLQWMGPVAHLSDVPKGLRDAREVPSYKAISAFLNRPYFRAVWMLEAMAVARFPAFLLGDDIISWMQVLRLNRVNEEITDHGADMFPDELRPLLNYLPLGSVYAFLKEFDARQRSEGHHHHPAMGMGLLTTTRSSGQSSSAAASMVAR